MAFIYNIIKDLKRNILLLQAIFFAMVFGFTLEVQAQYSGPPVEKDITLNIGEAYTLGDSFSGESHWKCNDELKINNLPEWMAYNVNSSEWNVKGTPTTTGSFTADFKVQEYAHKRYFDHCVPSDSKTANNGSEQAANAEDSYNVTLNITVIDSPPEITSSPIKDVTVGNSYSYSVVANDPEGQSLSYSKVTGPIWLSFTGNILTGSPSYNDSGNHAIEIDVSDGTNHETQVYTLKVSSADRPPKINTSPPTTAIEGEKYNYVIEAEDPDGDNISYSLAKGPAWLKMDGSHLHGTPGMTDKGSYSIKIQVSANGKSDTQNYTLHVNKTTQGPTINSAPVDIAKVENPYRYEIRANDNENNKVIFTLEKAPDFLKLAGKKPVEGQAVLVGKPSENDIGEHEIIIKATDDGNPEKSSQQQFTLAVSIGNNAPVIESQPVKEINVEELYKYSVRATDSDGDEVSLTATGPDGGSLPRWLSFKSTKGKGTLAGRPTPTDKGTEPIILTATDNGQPKQSTVQKFEININPKSVSQLSVYFVYPNACRGRCTIKFALPTKQSVYMKVWSAAGNLVRKTKKETYPQGVNEIEFLPKKLPSGKYSFTIISQDMSYNAEFTLIR